MKVVVDVSAMVPYLLNPNKEMTAMLQEYNLVAPVLFLSESGNTLLKYLNRNLITLEEANKLLNQSKELISQFIHLSDYSGHVMRLASEYNLTFYDSEYFFDIRVKR